MEPTIIELNKTVALTKEITVEGKKLTEVNLEKIIIRPVIKRIVFITKELNRIIVYDGEVDFEAHKDDSEEVLTAKLLEVIDSTYGA
jgi:hypothetical protein